MFGMHNSFTVASVSKNKPKKNICGSLVRRLRKKLGWTIEQLAAKITVAGVKMSDHDMEAIESGERRVLDHEVLAIARALSLTVEELLAGRRTASRRSQFSP